jgi:hypothetical protein
MRHLMIDLETMGTRVNAPVVGIGACFFEPDTGEIGPQFGAEIDLSDAMRYGAASGDTVKWWLKQDDDARLRVAKDAKDAETVFRAFYGFCEANCPASELRPWGNGAGFDISILDYAFPKILNKQPPWRFYNVRDCRTIRELAEGIVEYTGPMVGTKHVALDDAIHQANYVSCYWQGLRRLKAPTAAPFVLDI